MSYTIETRRIEAYGQTFDVSVTPDDCYSTPWEECDGHGPVRKSRLPGYSRRVNKSPGERVLHVGDNGYIAWLYDWQEAIKIAAKDGWSVSPENRPDNWDVLTKRQQTELAVQRDFDYLQAWCDGRWMYCGVCVQLLVPDEDGDLVDYDGAMTFDDALWGVDYWHEFSFDSKRNSYAKELVDGMMRDIADQYNAELAEKLACEERDIVTEAA